MQTPLFFRLFGPNVLHHHWGAINACQLFHAHFNTLFYSANHKIFVLVSALQKKYRMRRIPKREMSLHEDLKNSATFKKEDLISSKIGQYWANLISRIEFVSSVSYIYIYIYIYIYFYQTHAGSSLLLAFTMPLATSVTVHVIAQKITDTPHVKPQSTKRFEVGRLYILKINVNS